MVKTLKKVTEQYEVLPYPSVDPEKEKTEFHATNFDKFDIISHFCFEGQAPFLKPNFRALVAGGGTGNATITLAESLRDYGGKVVHVDLSSASIKLAKKRAEIRRLDNIEWVLCSIEDLPQKKLGVFDYINCTGVLHHLENPQQGLSILSHHLADHGSMLIMLYAPYGRMPIYMLQSLMKLINHDAKDIDEEIMRCRHILAELPQTHWFYHADKMFLHEILSNEGLYDLLLHAQDRAYSVDEIYDLANSAKLHVGDFVDSLTQHGNAIYDPENFVTDKETRNMFDGFSVQKKRSVAELMYARMPMHHVYLHKQETSTPSLNDLDMVPYISVSCHQDLVPQILTAMSDIDELITINGNAGAFSFQNQKYMREIFKEVDGQQTLRKIYKKVMKDNKNDKSLNIDTLGHVFSQIFEPLNEQNWLFLKQKNIPKFQTIQQMTDRVGHL